LENIGELVLSEGVGGKGGDLTWVPVKGWPKMWKKGATKGVIKKIFGTFFYINNGI
jgi:hypothetical protein